MSCALFDSQKIVCCQKIIKARKLNNSHNKNLLLMRIIYHHATSTSRIKSKHINAKLVFDCFVCVLKTEIDVGVCGNRRKKLISTQSTRKFLQIMSEDLKHFTSTVSSSKNN